MISAEERKRDIISSIEDNPTDITLTIATREVIDGAWNTTEATSELRVRIFQQKSTEVTIISNTEGTADTTKKYGMLVDYTSTIINTSRQDIVFDSPYGRMEVIGVYPQILKGVICGYQCDLKRVS